ncbi:hypothetical protein GT037_007945 [Alternaria burnsii]|uniref:Uncharacterized protein n=1 Tax=Alternaria burnsii TaxID=1187904 RepID=A0A8H7B407_9PLEO|nr:uncharacterized protein GT037_007945 [Alternaria burnsii]KAF7674179.1 hypothetical protein GT037_007945 [Alternaria burnsii]
MEVFLVPVRARWQLKMELRQKTAVLVVFEWVLCGSLDWLERRACARSIQCDGGWLLWIVLSSHAYGTMGLYLAGEPNDTGLRYPSMAAWAGPTTRRACQDGFEVVLA